MFIENGRPVCFEDVIGEELVGDNKEDVDDGDEDNGPSLELNGNSYEKFFCLIFLGPLSCCTAT